MNTGTLWVALAATSWGFWSLLFRPAEALGPLSATLEALWVHAGIALINLPMALQSRPPHKRKPSLWGLLVLVGFIDALNGLLFFQAMRYTTVAVAVLTHSVAPLLVAALAPYVTGERPERRTYAAVLAAFAGLVLVLEPWRAVSGDTLYGAAFGLASAVLYAALMLLLKRLDAHFSPAEVASYHSFPAVLLLAVLTPSFSLEWGQALYLGIGAIGPGGLAAFAFVYGLQKIPASRAALLVLLEPLVATMLGIFYWREPFRPLAVVGGVIVLASLASTMRGAAPRGASDEGGEHSH
jgi:drug/metabolite transporter, DME family